MSKTSRNQITNYTFVASTKTITLTGITVDISRLISIVNQTRGVTYYSPSIASLVVTASGSDIILNASVSTAGHANSDRLHIAYVEDDSIGNIDDSAASSDTGSFSIISFLKRGMQNWATLLARIPALVSGRVPVDGSGVTQPVSASALPLPAGASTESTLAAINTKTPALGATAPTNSSPVTLPNDVVVGAAASIAALNTDLLTGTVSGWYDAQNFHSVSIQLIGAAGISAGQIIFEQTNDITAAPAGNVWILEDSTLLNSSPIIAATTIAASTIRLFGGQIASRYIRVRVSTGFAGGTVQAVAVLSQLPYQRMINTIQQATAANLNITMGNSLPAGTNLAADVGVQLRANATGAASRFHLVSAATTNATSVKGSAGRLVGWSITNVSGALRYVKLHNIATAPTAGVGVVQTITIPPNQTANHEITAGIAFTTGIGMTTVTGAADNDATGVGAAELIIDLFFA